ncbi:MAG: signal peptidase II [Pseudoclavibacter sp.]
MSDVPSEDAASAPARPPRSRTTALVLLAAVAVVLYGSDQLVKAVVEANMVEGQVIEALGPVLQWHFVRNPGAAFSFAAGQTWIFTTFAAIVVIAIAVLSRRIRSIAWAVVFGLVLGGVLGNLTDRLFREPGFGVGHVVDYISTPWLLPAIYNIADMGIVFGMATFVLLTLRDVRLDGTRGTKAKAAGEAVDADTGSVQVARVDEPNNGPDAPDARGDAAGHGDSETRS